jgi:hypothetical protein
MRTDRVIVIFSIATLNLSVQGIAQRTYPEHDTIQNKRTIILSGGAAIPVGAFGSSSSESDNFPLSGIAISAQFAASILGDCNVTGGMACSYHRYDESSAKEVMRDSLPKYTVHAGGYLLAEILAGIQYDVWRTSRFTFFGRVQVGVLISTHPEIREDNITPSGSGRRTISAVLATSPVLDIGGGVMIKNCWWFGVSYIIGNTSFTRSVYEAHGTTPTAYFTKRISQTIATVQLLIGYSIDV